MNEQQPDLIEFIEVQNYSDMNENMEIDEEQGNVRQMVMLPQYMYEQPIREPTFRFSGKEKEDPKLFIFKLNSHVNLHKISEQDIPTILPFVFSDNALRWYQQIGQTATSYGHFTQMFYEKYLNRDLDSELKMKMKHTKQSESEKLHEYISKMVEMNQRLAKPIEDDDFLDILRANILYEFAVALTPTIYDTFPKFEREARRLQALKDFRKSDTKPERNDTRVERKPDIQGCVETTSQSAVFTQSDYQPRQYFPQQTFFRGYSNFRQPSRPQYYPRNFQQYGAPRWQNAAQYQPGPRWQNTRPYQPGPSWQSHQQPVEYQQPLTVQAEVPTTTDQNSTETKPMEIESQPPTWNYGQARGRSFYRNNFQNRGNFRYQNRFINTRFTQPQAWGRSYDPNRNNNCFLCLEPGHWQRDCPLANPENLRSGWQGTTNSLNLSSQNN